METHSLLVIADSLTAADIPEELKKESADVRHLAAESFGIDEARRLKEMAGERSWGGSGHHFIIAARSLTSEAQNALLKLLEEPPSGATFYLVVPHESLLLPTLRSRLFLHGRPAAANDEPAADFLRSSYKDRLETIADLAKKDPDALKRLARALGRSADPSWPAEAKRALLLVDRYVYNRGASKKMLLEELALSLPQGKLSKK